ncbi:unnamed protein product [Paramecium sonneborni]|uniref:Uncharacterized protein n=1 Tax=Paramecium sonneborni TaxID=65129 RepID=A0A8S1RQZ3_9CILI|nr:unnamed protein product [Paramecium sonneborni]
MAEKMNKTGVKVVRVCSKTRENWVTNDQITIFRFGLIIIGNARVLNKVYICNYYRIIFGIIFQIFRFIDIRFITQSETLLNEIQITLKFFSQKTQQYFECYQVIRVYIHIQLDNLNQFDQNLILYLIHKYLLKLLIKMKKKELIFKGDIINIGQYSSPIMLIGTFQNDLQLDI